jgi:DNA-directed RNA polymerase specialized sigma24 family protein
MHVVCVETVEHDAPGPAGPRGDEGELFSRHRAALTAAVNGQVNASPELIADACQNAWLLLLRNQPQRGPTLFAWLRTVAIREAWRLSRREHRDARLEDLPGHSAWDDLIGAAPAADHVHDARRALEALAALPEGQRRDLVRVIGGYSYREIADADGDGRTIRNVDKHLLKARRRLRLIETLAA